MYYTDHFIGLTRMRERRIANGMHEVEYEREKNASAVNNDRVELKC